MSNPRVVTCLLAGLSLVAATAQAQSPAPTRLAGALPADVANHVARAMIDARARGLPAEALESRALRFAAKGVAPADIERSVDDHLARMSLSRDALVAARGAPPSGDEIDAAAEVVRKGVTASRLQQFAHATPAERSLAVPMLIVSSLIDEGLSPDSALRAVSSRVATRASDADMVRLSIVSPTRSLAGQVRRSDDAGPDATGTLSPVSDAAADKHTGTTTTPSGDGKRPPTTTPAPATPKRPPTTPTTTTPPAKPPTTTTGPTTTKPPTTTPPATPPTKRP